MVKKYWLLKTEGDVYPIDTLMHDKKTPWSGVRNYKARNYMRDDMNRGDLCLFYHSSSKANGVYGIAKVDSLPYPDPTQFDEKSDYYDPQASEDKPIWILVDIAFVRKIENPVLVEEMKRDPALKDMILWKAPRLSIQPVSEAHFKRIVESHTHGHLL